MPYAAPTRVWCGQAINCDEGAEVSLVSQRLVFFYTLGLSAFCSVAATCTACYYGFGGSFTSHC